MKTHILAGTMAIFVIVPSFGRAQAFTVKSQGPKLVTEATLAQAEKESAGGKADADKKSISISGKVARLVVRTGPENDMMSYRILGLRNPTIQVKPGATLSILFVNTDGDMVHDLRFTAKQPPFDAKVGKLGSVGSAGLPHGDGKRFSSQELTVQVPSKTGTYSYICTTAGHAAAGMFGKVIVR